MNKAEFWIEKLGLIKHPEGGWYKEVYKSGELIKKEHLPDRFGGPRHHSTSIYFLLTSDVFSAFHRIKSDELWHFYDGSPVKIHMISGNGIYSNIELGNDGVFQYVIPHGTWFAAEIEERDSYALVGCTVSPGFDFDDFEMGKKEELIEKFSEHEKIINRFTRD